MWEQIAPLVDLFKAHAYGACALGALLFLANLLIGIKTPVEWIVWLDGFPRAHAVLDMVRAAGFQPVDFVKALVRLIKGTPPKAPGGGDVVVVKQQPGTGGASSLRTSLMLATMFVFLALSAGFVGCSFFESHPAVAPSAEQLAICYVDHALAGDGIAKIVLDCGGDELAVIGALETASDPLAKTYDLRVVATPARAEARQLRATLAAHPEKN